MKKELHLIRNTFGIATLLFLTSCRSTDTENTINGNGISAVSFNLIGTDYVDSGKLSGQASIGKGGIPNSDNDVQRHSVLITPSSIITAELSPASTTSRVSANASLGIKPLAASGNPLTSGMKFRIIAYKNNGDYHTHEDYTVGQPAIPMMLDNGAAYNIVVYSYGTTSLPTISLGEQTNISSATVNYDDANRDFMYQNIAFTPTNSTNTLNITLRHKVAQITTIVNSVSLGNITNITGGVLTSHYSNGSIPLSTGVMTGRTTLTSGSALNFSGLNTTTATAAPVFVNADTGGNATGGFSADMTIGGVTKTISLPNSFKITPENKSNLTINLMKCGAYLGPGDTNWKQFACHNLGADTTANPFMPSAAIHGGKYQWGSNGSVAEEGSRWVSQKTDQANWGIITGWIPKIDALPDGTWSDASKTGNDPCPTGYRVPTAAQWNDIISNPSNKITALGPWTSVSNITDYDSGLLIGRGLFLPSSGWRDETTGFAKGLGITGYYASSSLSTGSTVSSLHITNSIINIVDGFRTTGVSVRCIAE
ncbi:hypothetical protein [Elizabethkingia anophelis]|uniref:hypothetical protein n=1 Tax=Elizabethkingia anophelis TaxID=1117645 RepID=UPI003208688D